jgi:fatty acid CoA ligase FadD36
MSTVIAVVGGMLAGVPVVPLPPDAGADETAYMLADSGAAPYVADTDTAGSPVPVALDAPRTAMKPAAATALVLYTSGTTGPPKGVEIGHDAIAADLDALADAWTWTADDTLVHGLPMFHVHGLVLGVLGPLRVGGRLVHTIRPAPTAYAAVRGSMYFGVPTVWSRVCAEPAAARELASARLLVSGSAPLPRPVFERLTFLTGQRPIERYGMTETLITCRTRADGERRPGSVGRAISGVSTRLAARPVTPVRRRTRRTAISANSKCRGRCCSVATSGGRTRQRRRSPTTDGSAPVTSLPSAVTACTASSAGPAST